MACKGWLGNATSTGSSGIVAAAFHSTATNAKSYKTQLKSFEIYCQSFLHFVRALICFGKPSRLTNAPVLKVNKPKVWGGLLDISMVRSMCSNIAREWQRQNALTVTMSLCPYVIVCDVSYFFFQQPLHIVTTSWMIWQMLRWAKSEQTKSVGRFIGHFHGPQYVFKYCQRMTKTKCTDCHYVTMSLCDRMWCQLLLLSAAIAHSYY